MTETVRKDLWWEVVRDKFTSEEDFLAAMTAAGFTLVKNYAALPLNYRFSAPDDMTPDQVKARLNDLPVVWQDGDKSDEQVARGESFTCPQTVTVTLEQPLDRVAHQPDDFVWSLQGYGEDYESYAQRQKRHWGVGRVLEPSSGSNSFSYVKAGDYTYTQGVNGNGVDYYILDTGVYVNHPEFLEDIFGSRVTWVSGGDDTYQTGTDDQRHGTHMAGCGVGKTMGLAVNCRVFSAKGLDGNNSGTSAALIDGMNALVAAFTADSSGRPGVMNNSWSTSSSTAYTAAVDAAVDAGMVMVASRGNSNSSAAAYPASYDDVISVGAFDIDDYRSSFSQYPADVWAPGREILGPVRGEAVDWLNGTSPAGALLTAAVCCLLQGYRRPAGRTDVLAVKSYVESLAVSGAITSIPTGNGNVVVLGPGDQTTRARISGLRNMLVPWFGGIRTVSVNKNVSTGPGLKPSARAKSYWQQHALSHPLHWDPATSSPTAASDATVTTKAGHKMGWWLTSPRTVGADPATDWGVTGEVHDLTAVTDADGDALTVPNRDGAGNFAFLGSNNGALSKMSIEIPVRMVPESNPVSLDDIATNLNWWSGDFTGWTTSGAGTPQVKTANLTFYAERGIYFFEGTGGADSQAVQTVDISSAVDTGKIDAGEMYLYFSATFGTSFIDTPGDQGRVLIEALDASDVDLGDIWDSGVKTQAGTGSVNWDNPGPHRDEVLLPANTRKLRITVFSIFQAGTVVNCPICGLEGYLYEKTKEGDRNVAMIDQGLAAYEIRHNIRSFNIDSDDQIRSEIDFMSFGADQDNAQKILEHNGDNFSPHNWCYMKEYIDIPVGTRVISHGYIFTRRAGTVINAYVRDISSHIRWAPPQQRGSINKNISGAPTFTVPNNGGQSGVVVMVGS